MNVIRLAFHIALVTVDISFVDLAGTDGRDYPSECDLQKTACERRETALNVRDG